jgi:hypothetical protein
VNFPSTEADAPRVSTVTGSPVPIPRGTMHAEEVEDSQTERLHFTSPIITCSAPPPPLVLSGHAASLTPY